MTTYTIQEKLPYSNRRRFKKITYTISDKGCWECNSHFTDKFGYPKAQRGFKKDTVHRIVFQIFNGKIPDGMLLRHTCDNPLCINPNHGIIGTQKDNAMDKVERDRVPKGTMHHATHLEEWQVIEIYQDTIHPQIGLSKIFGISQTCVSKIQRGQRWSHLTKNVQKPNRGILKNFNRVLA